MTRPVVFFFVPCDFCLMNDEFVTRATKCALRESRSKCGYFFGIHACEYFVSSLIPFC